MSSRSLTLNGQSVHLMEEGTGPPILYLHGFADTHSAVSSWMPFHEDLQRTFQVIAPAHPGCASSGGLNQVDEVEDLVFHYLDLADELGLGQLDLVGTCVGGWIAAELAIRHPERVRHLALIGATGLHVPGHDIGDLFMLSQSRDGGNLTDLRSLLFQDPGSELAKSLYPDIRAGVEEELLRYQMLTFSGRIGWNPPYLYDRKLRGRLARVSCPTLVIWGADDRMVPPAHGQAYADGVRSGRLEVLPAGHSVHLERPTEVARLIREFVV